MDIPQFHAALSSRFTTPVSAARGGTIYRCTGGAVNLDGLLMAADPTRDPERHDEVSLAGLFRRAATSSFLLDLAWDQGGDDEHHAGVWAVQTPQEKGFVCVRPAGAPAFALAAFAPRWSLDLLRATLELLLADGCTSFGLELFGALPERTLNLAPRYVPRDVVRAGYWGYARRRLREREECLFEAWFAQTYVEPPRAALSRATSPG